MSEHRYSGIEILVGIVGACLTAVVTLISALVFSDDSEVAALVVVSGTLITLCSIIGVLAYNEYKSYKQWRRGK